MHNIYDPGEDSYMLEKYVKELSYGKVLDMGCGSGIQGVRALESDNVSSVTFADMNPKALDYCRTQVHTIKNVNFISTDLFNNINDKYDTIIFNPPYLPKDEFDHEHEITTGGVHGYELIIRFLKDAIVYLEDNGIILLVFSSLSNKKILDKTINIFYNKKILGKENYFMESLYVYQLWNKKDIIFKGHRGIVSIELRKIGNNMQKVAIKKPLYTNAITNYNSDIEYKFINILNKYSIGPQAYSNENNSIVMEYIEGKNIIEYLTNKNITKFEILHIIRKILEQLLIMDKLGINKMEMTHPYKHIIIDNKTQNPVLIDFERCRYTNKPKNITQFMQFITSSKFIILVKSKNIIIDNNSLGIIAREYKKDNKENSDQIIDRILAHVI